MNLKYIALLVAVVVLATIGLTFIPKPQNAVPSSKMTVMTSFYPVYFLAQQIAGDKAEVINITPAGTEPHDYEPTPQQIAQIEQSKLLVTIGGVEAWADRVKQSLGTSTLVINAGEGLQTQQLKEGGETIADPHIWLSPTLAASMARRIEQGLEQIDPGNKYYYQLSANGLITALEQLDLEFKESLAHCAKKDIITSHAAFGYLANSYSLHQVPITGLSPDAEPSAKDLASIADFAKKNNVRVIFFESLVSPKLSQTIAKEVGAQTAVLDPIEGMTAADSEAGKNYLTQMRQNLSNLKIALECK